MMMMFVLLLVQMVLVMVPVFVVGAVLPLLLNANRLNLLYLRCLNCIFGLV
jgi:hypothetical protein